MTKEQFAAMLHGREYGSEITKEEEAQAESDGLVVVFGYSYDCMEIRGAITDEMSCWEGDTFWACNAGVFYDEFKGADKLDAIWLKDGYSFVYETLIPHATFDILEYGDKYCRGIVFNHSDLPNV